jgi:hypothetical protein
MWAKTVEEVVFGGGTIGRGERTQGQRQGLHFYVHEKQPHHRVGAGRDHPPAPSGSQTPNFDALFAICGDALLTLFGLVTLS